MEELKNEQTEVKSHPAEAEQNEGEGVAEVSLGKFKDVNALLSAYNSLESEFTKRCQKIKELESALSAIDKESPKAEETAKKENQPEDISGEKKEEILKEYLTGILGRKQKAIVLDGSGVGVKTPVHRPKTIRQAGELAKEIFSK